MINNLLEVQQQSILERKILEIVSYNLSALSQPCFRPSLKVHFYELIKLCNVTEKQLRQFTHEMWRGRKESRFDLHNDHIVIFYLKIAQYFLNLTPPRKDVAKYIIVMIAIKHWTARNIKHFKVVCQPDIFALALERMSKTHLFSRERSIPNALFFLSNEAFKRFEFAIKNWNIDEISKFIIIFRHRIAQSLRSFAEKYYAISKSGEGIRTQKEILDAEGKNIVQITSSTNRFAESLAKKITIDKHISKNSVKSALSLSKVDEKVGDQLLKELSNSMYVDNITDCLTLLLQPISKISYICGPEYYKYVKKLLSQKITNKTTFKFQIISLLDKLISGDKNLSKIKSNLCIFIAYFLALTVRENLCSHS